MIHPLAAYDCCKGVLWLKESYPVLLGDKSVGEVRISRQGLFLSLFCKCTLENSSVHRIYLRNSAQKHDLGILIPEQDYHTLCVHIPARMLSGENIVFCVDENEKKFSHYSEDNNNALLSDLERAYLKMNGSNYQIMLYEEGA